MGAGATAVANAKAMIDEVARIGTKLGLVVTKNVEAGQTIWATDRRIKVVLQHESTRGKTKKERLGVECIHQDGPGTANQKFFAKVEDVKHWPLKGVVVYDGHGFKTEFQGVMDTYGAIKLGNFEKWLRAFFNLQS